MEKNPNEQPKNFSEKEQQRPEEYPLAPETEIPRYPKPEDNKRIVEIRKQLSEEVVDNTKNRSETRQGLLESVDIKNLPIDWEALNKLGRALNELEGNQYSRGDLADIKPPLEAHSMIGMVASVVAHRENEEIPIKFPTQEEIKALKPWLRSIEHLIGRISPRWSNKFGKYIENKGKEAVLGAGKVIIETAELFDSFENPKQQFLDEIANLYKYLQRPVIEEGFFSNSEMPIETKIENLFSYLKYRNTGQRSYEIPILNEKNFPMLFRLTKRFNFPSLNFNESDAGVAGAEFMYGIEMFLRSQGIRDIRPAPRSQEFDIFDIGSWKRGLAEMFAGERLEKVKQTLPTVLDLIKKVLPENGDEFARAIYEISENICTLERENVAPQEITKHVFKKRGK